MWCEHCRDHYETDHYATPDGGHGAGAEFGFYGLLLAGAEIVRALAAMPSDDLECYGDCGCTFCGRFGPDDHDPTCLWRLAREWVAANSPADAR
jgi:hypothetical protein